MTVEARLADGRVLEFPDGTDPQVIQATVKRVIAEGEQGQRAGVPESLQAQQAGITGVLEPALTLATGAIAEPLAGLAGIAAQLIPGGKTGGEMVEATREALTFQPRTQAGQRGLQAVGRAVAPIGEAFSAAEKALGDKTLDVTGSPALAALASTIPTVLAEVVGFTVGKGALRGAKAAKEGQITREIAEAAPTAEVLKDTSRQVFREIDELGVTVKPEAYRSLVAQIKRDVTKGGIDKDITPDAAKALRRLEDVVGEDLTLSELDNLRTIAQNATGSIKPSEKRLGNIMIDSIDNFLDRSGVGSLNKPEGVNIGQRYKVARELWGRARKSETISDAIETARNQATGFENGIRVQFRRILNNKKQRKFFKENELKAMKQVVEGTKGANIAKLLGRLGFSEGGATNIIGGALGATAGGVAFGTPGAVFVPIIGQVSRKVAQKLTEGNAKFADEVIRAGKDGRKITKAYLDNTPVGERNPLDLSELLLRNDIDLTRLDASALAQEAARLATERRTALASAAAGGALVPDQNTDTIAQ